MFAKSTSRARSTPSRQAAFWSLPIALFIGVALSLSACTRQTIPLIPMGPGALPPTDPPPAATLLGPVEQADSYSVAWKPEDETLKIHNPAGIAGTVIGELPYDRNGIQLTGGATSLGSSIWVEIRTREGLTGWVNKWNLTETVREAEFCSDARIPGIVTQVLRALEARDGGMLADYVNPERGLIVRHDWWNPEVLLPYDQIPQIFDDQIELDFGVMSGAEFRIEGSFDELVRPLILDTAQSDERFCNELPSGTTTRPANWPTEYSSLNYIAIYRPAPEDGNRFNWRTWAFTFEYIDGRPFLTVLVQFYGDI